MRWWDYIYEIVLFCLCGIWDVIAIIEYKIVCVCARLCRFMVMGILRRRCRFRTECEKPFSGKNEIPI